MLSKVVQLLVTVVWSYAGAHCQILPFHTYTTKDGLISNTITSLCQDSRGYIWVGTYDGVSMYDGSAFKNYTTTDGLANSVVWTIIESRRSPGTMFLGTNGGGVNLVTDGKVTSRRLGSSLSSNQVPDLLEDRLGNLWCVTSSGIIIVAGDSLLTLPDGIDSMMTSNLAQTMDSIVWFGCGHQLLGYNAQRQRVSQINIPIRKNASILALSVDDDGDFWIVSSDSVISHCRNRALLEQRRISIGAPGWVRVSPEGIVWIKLHHSGIGRISKHDFAAGHIEHLTEINGLHDINIWTILFDSEHDVWLAGFSRGLAKLSEPHVYRFPLQATSPSNAPYRGGGLDGSGRYWAATEDGLTETWSAPDGWHQSFHAPAGNVAINSMTLEKEKNRLWICDENGAITSFFIRNRPALPSALTKDQRFSQGKDLPSGPLVGCAVFEAKYLWCIIDPNVVVIDLLRGSSTILRGGIELPVVGARALFRDSKGNVWIGGYNDGLACLPGGDLTKPMKRYTTADGLPDNGIRSIAETRDGTLWFGTRYGGVAEYDGQSFHVISARDGLLSNAVWSLAEDSDHRLWIATSLGLMYMERKPGTTFGWNNELLGVSAWSCHVDDHNRLWSVTSEGVSLLDATSLTSNYQPPPVYVTRLLVNGKPSPFGIENDLSYDENNIALQYVGLSFKHEKANRYRYRLRGEEWSSPTPERSVTYASLAPGSYTFDVTAYNADGIASVSPATVSFTILPPFWQRLWFVALVSIAVAGMVYALYRYRLNKLLEVERLRTRIASDLHDDIGSGLTRIAILSDMAAKQTRDIDGESPMQKAGALARELHDVITDVVWSINPARELSLSLVRRLRVFATEMCEGCGVELNFSASDEIEHFALSPEVRRSVLLIVKEAVTNSCRHASCTHLSVGVHSREGFLILSLVDNGRGFDPGRLTRISGLANMKRRAEKAGGTLSITSSPGNGASIDASIPVK